MGQCLTAQQQRSPKRTRPMRLQATVPSRHLLRKRLESCPGATSRTATRRTSILHRDTNAACGLPPGGRRQGVPKRCFMNGDRTSTISLSWVASNPCVCLCCADCVLVWTAGANPSRLQQRTPPINTRSSRAPRRCRSRLARTPERTPRPEPQFNHTLAASPELPRQMASARRYPHHSAVKTAGEVLIDCAP